MHLLNRDVRTFRAYMRFCARGTATSAAAVQFSAPAQAENGNDNAQDTLFRDGISLARLEPTSLGPPGVDRIEVFRGAKGALYGNNSSVGIVNITSRDPDSAVLALGHAAASVITTKSAPGARSTFRSAKELRCASPS